MSESHFSNTVGVLKDKKKKPKDMVYQLNMTCCPEQGLKYICGIWESHLIDDHQ